MTGHYLTTALRNLLRHRLHSAVSVIVLTLGVSCFLAAYLVVSYLRSYDQHFANADRTFVVFQGMHGPKIGFDWPSYPFSSTLLAEQLALDVPELQAVARYRPLGSLSVVAGAEQRQRPIATAEPKFLAIFGFDVISGSLESALIGHNAVVTASGAQALFGTSDVVGRAITVTRGKAIDVAIAAVIADPPPASTFNPRGLWSQGFDVLLPWDETDTAGNGGGWFNTNTETYALLPADNSLTVAELDRRLTLLVKNHVPDQGIEVSLTARPISAIASSTMQSQIQGFEGSAWRVDVFTALLLFAGTVLAVSCVNFVNLAIARAGGRAREIGIRKAIGSTAKQITHQALIETGAITFVSLALALIAVATLGDLVPNPWRLAFAIPWHEPRLWSFALGLLVAVTMLAGLYPALVLARIRPLSALRLGTRRAGSATLRLLLVGSQFALASFLVSIVTVTFSQRHDLRAAILGRFVDQYVLVMPVGGTNSGVDVDVLTSELAKGPGIKAITATSTYAWRFIGSRPQYSTSPGEDQRMVTTESTNVGHDYFATMDIPVLAGRAFARARNDEFPAAALARGEDPGRAAVVLDRQAAHALGWADPLDAIGKTIYNRGNTTAGAEVIGVVESVPIAIRDRGSQGVVYRLAPQNAPYIVVRIDKNQVEASLKHVDRVFKELSPTNAARSVQFFDQAFEGAYFTFAMINRVFFALGAIAIAIAAVGLFGMASYATGRRRREIGVRKSQGARTDQIVALLLWDFSKPILVANLFVFPVALLAALRYLNTFAERAPITPLPFLTALGLTLIIACLAVGGRVMRAASVRPADVLREN